MNKLLLPVLMLGLVLIAIVGVSGFQRFSVVTSVSDNTEIPSPSKAQTGSKASGVATAITVLFQDITGSSVTKSNVAIVPLMPTAPRGWSVSDYQNADGEAIMQAEIIRSVVYKNSTNQLLLAFEGATKGRKNEAALTFTKDDQTVAFLLRANDQFNANTVRGGIMVAIQENVRSATDFGETSDVFALHHGVPFTQADQVVSSMVGSDDIPVDFRVFTADIGGMFSIKIVTDGSDAAVAKVIEAIPMSALIAALPDPEPQLLVSAAFSTRDAVLSDEKPGPTIARKAYLIEKTRLNLSNRDKSMLGDMIDGDIKVWEDAFDEFGTALTIDPAILALLGPLPELTQPQYNAYSARAMLEMDDVWTDTDKRILSALANKRSPVVDQSGIGSYLSDGEAVSKDVIALISKLPEAAPEKIAEAVATETPEVARDLVIRRGNKTGKGASTFGSCSIENGVRRCIVGSAGDN